MHELIRGVICRYVRRDHLRRSARPRAAANDCQQKRCSAASNVAWSCTNQSAPAATLSRAPSRRTLRGGGRAAGHAVRMTPAARVLVAGHAVRTTHAARVTCAGH